MAACVDNIARNRGHGDLAKAGVRLHWITMEPNKKTKWGPQIWQADGKYDFTAMDRLIVAVLQYDPSMLLQIYLNILPYPEFADVHPDAAWVNARGSKIVGEKESVRDEKFRVKGEFLTTSLTAPEYRAQSADFLKAFCEHLKKSDLGKAVIGFHLTGGTDGQWFYPGWKKGEGSIDRSRGNLIAFRQWLQKKYITVDSIRSAWKNPDLNFENIKMPEESARCNGEYYLSPLRDQAVIDANRFVDAGVTETINLFAKTIKENIGKNILLTTYYPNKLYDLKDWIEAPYLDGTVGVEEYGNWRNLGQTGEIATITGSLRLHGKYFLSELDYRTENASSWEMDANEFAKSIVITKGTSAAANVMRRSAGNAFTKGGGAWHFSLMGNSWNSKMHMKNISEIQKAAMMAAKTDSTDIAQIAVFVDESVGIYNTCPDIYSPKVNYQANFVPRIALDRSGVTWDSYLLSDLENPKLPDYKVYIFLSAAGLQQTQIQFIQHRLQRAGKVLLFLNNAGYFEAAGFTINIKKLTGMHIKQGDANSAQSRYIPVGSDRLSEGVENTIVESSGPVFFVDDSSATPLARISNTSKTGIAVKRLKGWTSVYSSLIGGVSPQLIRNMAMEAGIAPIGPLDEVVYAGNGLIVVHALKAGVKELNWGKDSRLIDMKTGKIVATNKHSITIKMCIHETRWFRKIK